MDEGKTKLNALCGSIIVSCQARPESPLHGPAFMSAMAKAAELGGAGAIRANGPTDVAAIKKEIRVPVIGINKIDRHSHPVYITPTFEAAREVAEAGADLVATDGTLRARPDGQSLRTLIARVHDELDVPVMADVDRVEAGIAAQESGADIVATTLSGYTNGSNPPEPPDLELVECLAREISCPVVAEGRYWTRDQVRAAFDAGAYAVVIGTAVTNPTQITKRFAAVRTYGS
jgi:N-acylglucosamine-6-phosphate 2-epimerase